MRFSGISDQRILKDCFCFKQLLFKACYMYEYFACMFCLCTMCVPGVRRGQTRVSDPQELE